MLPWKSAGLILLGLWLCFAPQPVAAQQIEVLWLGHATVRITSATGKVIVIDPYLKRNPSTPPRYRDLNALGKVDLILVTHGHVDHMADLPELARLTGAKVVAAYELGRNLVELGLLQNDKVVALNKGGTVEPLGRGVAVHMVQAEHSSSFDYDQLGLRSTGSKSLRYVGGAGPAVGFVVELDHRFKIYHSGDTDVFGDMALIHALYKPDLALVCIGGYFTMGPEGAAYAVRELIKPRMVLPIHYGTLPVLNHTPAEFKAALGDTQVEFLEVAPGQALRF